MDNYQAIHGINVASPLVNFLNDKVLDRIGVSREDFWLGFAEIVVKLTPKNAKLLTRRVELQNAIDAYHREHDGNTNFDEYKRFLKDIGYLTAKPSKFEVSTSHVDTELSKQAGAQLVVPIMNARYALNAANARWGSLYDALYGTDVIPENDGATKTKDYNPKRGEAVIAYAKSLLDQFVPLTKGSHHDVISYRVGSEGLVVELMSGDHCSLRSDSAFVGYQGDASSPSSILLKHNELHIDVQIDSNTVIGAQDRAGVKDIVLESALSTIMDCEDSVAAVDVEDKLVCYENWLGLMDGSLQETVEKPSGAMIRSLNPDRHYQGRDGETIILKGRSLMFVRNVGHLMTTDLVKIDDAEAPEGIIDAIVTSAIAMIDVLGKGRFANSSEGSIYIVKPKMHGPEEVAFANELFEEVEGLLGLERGTIKMGIMDEERRTSINLKACVYEARERVAFINTGFLDRTGDEIHTSMLEGPFLPKAQIKQAPWLDAYEKSNVDVGLSCGLAGRGQIGKGMWPIPDQMAAMMEQKIAHPTAGANTAWVPSPTAATLHAIHYHQVKVSSRQAELANDIQDRVDTILERPLLPESMNLTTSEIANELDNNIQGILGYVVRWVDQGVGCSKVPDINDVGLMEDRATLRISAQHVCNWLVHGIITVEQVDESLKRMAKKVDVQNAGDPLYVSLLDDGGSLAFNAARDLILQGETQPSGYTEPLLHAYRRKVKAIKAA